MNIFLLYELLNSVLLKFMLYELLNLVLLKMFQMDTGVNLMT